MATTSRNTAYKSQSIDSLVSELNCDNRIKCLIARRALEAKGQDAIPALVETLKNGEEMAPMHAAKALGHIGGPEAIQALVNALCNDRSGVRWAAAEALIERIPESVKPVLRALISSNNSSFVREGAHQVLSEIEEEPMKSVLAPVVQALEDGVPELEAPLQAKKALDTL
jgi:HEAT repeat protein